MDERWASWAEKNWLPSHGSASVYRKIVSKCNYCPGKLNACRSVLRNGRARRDWCLIKLENISTQCRLVIAFYYTTRMINNDDERGVEDVRSRTRSVIEMSFPFTSAVNRNLSAARNTKKMALIMEQPIIYIKQQQSHVPSYQKQLANVVCWSTKLSTGCGALAKSMKSTCRCLSKAFRSINRSKPSN